VTDHDDRELIDISVIQEIWDTKLKTWFDVNSR